MKPGVGPCETAQLVCSGCQHWSHLIGEARPGRHQLEPQGRTGRVIVTGHSLVQESGRLLREVPFTTGPGGWLGRGGGEGGGGDKWAGSGEYEALWPGRSPAGGMKKRDGADRLGPALES